MLSRLRNKFVAVIMLVTTILLCVLLGLVYYFTAINLESDSIRMMQSVSDGLGHGTFTPEMTHPNDRLHYFILSRTMRGDLIVTGNTSFDLSDQNLLLELYNTAASDDDGVGILKAYSLRYVQAEGGIPGMSYVFADISEETATLTALSRNCILIGIASFLILLVLTRLLVNWMVKPVEESWQQQKQFVADASHELKTPLTVILTNTELLTAPDYSPDQKREFADNIMAMSLRMRALVEGLLDLARIDSGVIKSAFENLNLSELTEDALLPFEPLYFESGRILESEIDPDIHLNGSTRHLEQVIGILLDNAMKYSEEGSIVRLTLHRQSRNALLCVDSCGEEIPAENLEKVFHRFYTADKARTGGSYGLGLPIASGIVQEHNGKIWAESENGHNRFYVRLPLN